MWWKQAKRAQRVTLTEAQPSLPYKDEMLGILLTSGALFLCIALVTFHPHDRSILYFSSESFDYHNWCGLIGAQLAAWLFYSVGAAAYLILICLLAPAYRLLMVKQKIAAKIRWRLSASVILVVASASLCALYDFDYPCGFAGGVCGQVLSTQVVRLFGFVGGSIMLWSFIWISFMMLAHLSVTALLITAWSRFWIFVKQCIMRLVARIHLFFQRTQHLIVRFLSFFKRRKDDKKNKELDEQKTGQSIAAPAVTSVWNEATDQVFWDTLGSEKKDWILDRVRDDNKSNQGDNEKNSDDNERGRKKNHIDQEGLPGCQQRSFILPLPSLFSVQQDTQQKNRVYEEAVQRGKKLEEKLHHFGIKGRITSTKPGPLITLFEYEPEITSKISKIVALEDDLALALSALSIRISAPIPGKNMVGFEIANKNREDVFFSTVIASKQFQESSASLPLALGVDIAGNPVVEDLTKMPHLLISGATGSGKSVGLHALLASLLCSRTPEQLKLILIDPKRLEFTAYTDIAHLLVPIVTNPVLATSVLKWVVQEMEERYEKMSVAGVRTRGEYQKLVTQGALDEAGNRYESMPFMVVIIDELADLMMVAGKEVEVQLVRIAQMARAAGIHLIIATQRPSVDVVTGLIKVNFTSRLAFRVSSKVDSRTILDQAGAEKLLGRGDALFMNASAPHLVRLHGAYLADQEIEALAQHIKKQQPPSYINLNEMLVAAQQNRQKNEPEDEIYPQVVEFIKTVEEISISLIQRHYRIGFNRSARIIEQLEIDGLIAPAQGSKARKVLR